MTTSDQTASPESEQFDTEFLHNFGPNEDIPEGASALCGAISTHPGPGETEPLRHQCCPICLTLTEENG